MIQYRPFLNSDPPALLRVWRTQPPERALMQPISNLLLETFVLSKPFFDREGLLVAVDNHDVVGFVHAGFGPNEQRTDLSTDIGLICTMIVGAHDQRHEIMSHLLERGEDYLRARGARELRAGATFPLSPFYLGLCGGSDLPGIPTGDVEMSQFYRDHGYNESDRTLAYDLTLHRYRPPVDRRIIQHRRQYRLIPQVNPRELSWWEACVFGPTDHIRFLLCPKSADQVYGQVRFWDMGPLATRPQTGGMGLIDLRIEEPFRRQGLGLFLAAETLRHLENSGVHRVESQTVKSNEAGSRLLNKLKFAPLREGVTFTKTV